jgi:hypothetical protein
MQDLPDVVGSGHTDGDALEGDGPEGDPPTTEICDSVLPVRHAADCSAVRPAHRMHDPEVLEKLLEGLINLR